MNRLFLLACAAGTLAPSARAAGPLPPDLALVPRGAVWVAHVRVGDVRKDPASVLARANVLRAVPKAFAGLDGQFAPKPSTFDRVTGFSITVPPPAPAGVPAEPKAVTIDPPPSKPGTPVPPVGAPDPLNRQAPPEDAGVILRCSAPFDRTAVIAGFNKDAKPEKVGGKDVVTDAAGMYAIAFVDDVTLVLGTKAAVLAVLTPAEPKGEHPLTEALTEAANPAHALTVGIADAKLFAGRLVPPDDTFKDVRTAVLTVDLGADPVVRGRVRFTDAGAAEKAIANVLEAGKKSKEYLAERKAQAQKQLAGDPAGPNPRPLADLPTALDGLGILAGIEWVESILAAPPLLRDGDTVSFTFVVHPLFARLIAPVLSWSALTALGGRPEGWPSLLFPSGAAARAGISNNLKMLALAAHNYHDANTKFPATTGTDKADKALLSWRVALLPYVEQERLYQQFKLDEPWDSEHNKKVLADNPMPAVFGLPGVTKPTDKVTHYQAFVGNGALFERAKGTTIPGVSDGLSNTILFALAKTPVEWTKPDDIAFDPNADPTKLLGVFDLAGRPAKEGMFWVAMADGSTRILKTTIKPATLRAAITRAGGEVVNLDE